MGCLDNRVMLFNLKLAACCLGLAVVNIWGWSVALLPPGGLRLHGSAWPYSSNPSEQQRVHTLTPVLSPLVRSRGVDGHHPTICREEEFDEDRFSGEYYSGEEFYEDDSMLSGER